MSTTRAPGTPASDRAGYGLGEVGRPPVKLTGLNAVGSAEGRIVTSRLEEGVLRPSLNTSPPSIVNVNRYIAIRELRSRIRADADSFSLSGAGGWPDRRDFLA